MSRPLLLIAMHSIDRPTDVVACTLREGQAEVMASLIATAASAGDHVIVLGDMNDFSEMVLDIQHHRPLSSVLTRLVAAGEIVNQTQGLVEVAAAVPESLRYSHWWDHDEKCVYNVPDQVSTLVHILMSRSLMPYVSDMHFGNDLFVQGCGTVSDHFPILVTLDVTQGMTIQEDDAIVVSE